MSRTRVDYDHLAPTYNRRFASGGHEGIAAALERLAKELEAERILETGCGTGYWLAGLSHTAGQVHGLDLSSGMLALAQQRPEHLYLGRGQASRLPYADGSFDLVYCVNAIHHFQDQAAFVHEAHRLLRPGGILAVAGTDPHSRRDVWYVYDYFEGTWDTDLARFPSWGTVVDWMVRAGFAHVGWRPVDWIHDPKVGRAVLDDPFLKKDACSQLALLSEEAYTTGMQRIEAILARAEAAGDSLTFESDLTLAMLTAQKALPSHDGPPNAAKAEDAAAEGEPGGQLAGKS